MHLYEQNQLLKSLDRQRIKLYSIGPDNELHGPALPRYIDGAYSRHIAQRAAEQTGTDYIGHLPYSGDKNPLMRNLNGFLENDRLVDMIVEHLSSDIEKRRKLPNNSDCSNIILVCGHEGNSFIQDNNTNIRILFFID